MKLKCWATLTVLLYAAILLLLAAPLIAVCSLKPSDGGMIFDIPFAHALDVYQEWSFWIWFGVLLTAQVVLLLIPLDLREKRLKPRVNVLLPITVSGFLLANLFFAGLLSLLVGVFQEAGWEAYAGLSESIFNNALSRQILSALGSPAISKDWQFALTFFQVVGVFWAIWAFIFYRHAKNDAAETLVRRITKWLMRGSILELLVAIPSHVLVRSKSTCCAPAASFWGIATGISVMLLAFGPGVFFLFAERVQRKKPKATLPPQHSQAMS